jgi:hypothetical protein
MDISPLPHEELSKKKAENEEEMPPNQRASGGIGQGDPDLKVGRMDHGLNPRFVRLVRWADQIHLLSTIVGLLGLDVIILSGWGTNALHNFPPPLPELPHPYAAFASILVLYIGWFGGRRGILHIGRLLDDTEFRALQAHAKPKMIDWARPIQLIANSVLGVALAWAASFTDHAAEQDSLSGDLVFWPAVTALALSEATYLASVWEAASIAEELRKSAQSTEMILRPNDSQEAQLKKQLFEVIRGFIG